MAAEDVGKGLEAMGDDAIREQVAGGDLSGLTDLELTDEEQEMLVGAAADYPEVEGFAFNTRLDKASKMPPPDFDRFGRYGVAAKYAMGKQGPGRRPGSNHDNA
jgi:hypothetical protein